MNDKKVTKTVKKQILSATMGIIVVFAVFSLIVTIFNCIKSTNETIDKSLPMIINLSIDDVDKNVTNVMNAMSVIMSNQNLFDEDISRSEKAKILNEYMELYPEYSMFGVTRADGTGYNNSGAATDISDREYFIEARDKKQIVISDAIFGKTTQKWVYCLAKPYYKNGQFAGVVYGAIDYDNIANIISKLKVTDNTKAYFVNKNNVIVTAEDFSIVEKSTVFDSMYDTNNKSFAPNKSEFSEGKSKVCSAKFDKEYLIGFGSIGTANWRMIILIPKGELTNFIPGLIAIDIIIYIVLFILIWYFIRIYLLKMLFKPLNTILTRISSAEDGISSSSKLVSESSKELADGSRMQAASIEEISESIENTTGMIMQTADGASQTAELAIEAKQKADRGTEKMRAMLESINDIRTSSNQIANIIKVIDDIASQTNILALNAAVEAARAGDAGKGFAVVAEEVRNLAQKSAEAAKGTQDIITSNINSSEKGVEVSKEVADALEEIYGIIEKINVISVESSSTTQEEAKGMQQITETIKSIENTVQSTSENAQTGSDESQKLASNSDQLADVINVLKDMI